MHSDVDLHVLSIITSHSNNYYNTQLKFRKLGRIGVLVILFHYSRLRYIYVDLRFYVTTTLSSPLNMAEYRQRNLPWCILVSASVGPHQRLLWPFKITLMGQQTRDKQQPCSPSMSISWIYDYETRMKTRPSASRVDLCNGSQGARPHGGYSVYIVRVYFPVFR